MKIVQKNTIFSPPYFDPYSFDYIYNFNHAPNLVKLNADSYLAAWFSGPWEGHPWQMILSSVFSKGRWTEAKVLQNTHRVSDYDPSFLKTHNKVFFFYSNARWYESKLYGENRGFLGTYFKYSEDYGVNWSESSLLCDQFACKSNGISLQSGALLLPVYNPLTNQVGVYKSINNGLSWELRLVPFPCIDVAEPAIVELGNSHILMCIRTKTGSIWQSESLDEGNSWVTPYPLKVESYNSPVCLLSYNNVLLLCYNPGKRRDKLCIIESTKPYYDWAYRLIIDAIDDQRTICFQPIHPSGIDRAVSYPSIILVDNNIAMLSWSKYSINETEHKGEIHCCWIEL